MQTDIAQMTKEELIELIYLYDDYIIDYMDSHGVCEDGSCPVCVDEFVDCEYAEMMEDSDDSDENDNI